MNNINSVSVFSGEAHSERNPNRGHLDTQHRQVSLQKRLDEILPLLGASRLISRQNPLGEPAAHPQLGLPLHSLMLEYQTDAVLNTRISPHLHALLWL